MNHIQLLANSATAQCRKSIQSRVFNLRARAFTVRINKCLNAHFVIQKLYQTLPESMKRPGLFIIVRNALTSSKQTGYTQPVDNFAQKLTLRSRHADNLWKLDSSGTLTARAFKGSERAATRIARSVAIVIGIALSMQLSLIHI